MWEKFKSFLLVVLILLSTTMSYRLWFGSPNYEAIILPMFERFPSGEESSAVSLLLPEKITYYPAITPPPAQEEPDPQAALTEQEEREQINEEEESEEQEESSEQEEQNEQVTQEESEERDETEDGFPHEKEDEEAHVPPETPRGGVYTFNFSQSDYGVLWEAFTQQLLRVESVSLSQVNPEEITSRLKERGDPSLELFFTAPFDAELFFSSRANIQGIQELPLIQNIFIFWEEEPKTFLQTSQESVYKIIWDTSFSSLFNEVKELSSTREPDHFLLSELADADSDSLTLENQLILEDLYVPTETLLLPDFMFSRDPAKGEALARTFFVDLSLVRQIKERDEAIIFTDGQKGLRISSKGMIEFTAPLQRNVDTTLSYREALELGTKFVSLYVDLPEEVSLRIMELKPVELGNKEYFQMKLKGYYGGLALDPESLMVEITYDEQGLVSYNCQSYILAQTKEEPVEVQVERALSEVQLNQPELFQGDEPRRITAAYLTYILVENDLEELLQPSWNIEIDGKYLIIVNARSGEVTRMKDVN